MEAKIRLFNHKRKGFIHAIVLSEDADWMKVTIQHEIKGLNTKWQAGETLDIRKSLITEIYPKNHPSTLSLEDSLKLAIEALNASKPTHNMYPEPVERHANAIIALKAQLEKIEAQSNAEHDDLELRKEQGV